MKTLLLLPFLAWLWMVPVSADPVATHPHRAGDLARDRLEGMDDILLSSDQVRVARPGQAETPTAPSQTKAVLACLADLVLDDALYVEEAEYDRNSSSETLVTGKWDHTVAVFIRRDKPYLTIMRYDGNRMVIGNYLPVLPKVVRLLHAMDPDDHTLDTFHPLSSPKAAAKGIPDADLARIATIKPGMTRTDVSKVFTTEGGVSTTYWNHYVYRTLRLPATGHSDSRVTRSGELTKVNIDFAPHDADIVWLSGRGFWLHQNDYRSRSKPTGEEEQPNDIILRVSPPYVQGMITD